MNRLPSFVSVSIYTSFAVLLLASCGGGDGTVDSCISSYTGTFTGTSDGGPSNGRILATLRGVFINEDGEEAGPLVSFQFVFDTKPNSMGEPSTASASESIMEDGNLAAPATGFRVMGSIDLETCEGSGMWVGSAFLGSGEWRIASPEAAL
ncbi:MAG TPA: hypothetical protein VNM90_04640 [Haliangium sp.]|nr:hypothetical protein [Haliangium sp.]